MGQVPLKIQSIALDIPPGINCLRKNTSLIIIPDGNGKEKSQN